MSVTTGDIIDPVTFYTRDPATGLLADRDNLSAVLKVAGEDTATVVAITSTGTTGEYEAAFTVPSVDDGDELELVLIDADFPDRAVIWREQGRGTTTPSGDRVVTWAQAKAHLRLDSDDEQDYVEALIDAATDYAQDAMACSLMRQTLSRTFRAGDDLTLTRGPLLEVLSVTDDEGVTLDADDYYTERVGHLDRLVITGGPSLTYPLTVSYSAGYASASAIPAGIRQSILMHVSTLYENRESVSEKGRTPVPHSLEDFYRRKARKVCVG